MRERHREVETARERLRWRGRQGFMQRAVFPSSGRVFAFQDGGFYRYPSTGRRRQTGRPNARPRTGCITRRTYVLRIIFKVLRLVYYCASVGADFYSFSYRTSCDLVARDHNLSPPCTTWLLAPITRWTQPSVFTQLLNCMLSNSPHTN